eukprot:4200564-Pyramimonas_sp.AAC.1
MLNNILNEEATIKRRSHSMDITASFMVRQMIWKLRKARGRRCGPKWRVLSELALIVLEPGHLSKQRYSEFGPGYGGRSDTPEKHEERPAL